MQEEITILPWVVSRPSAEGFGGQDSAGVRGYLGNLLRQTVLLLLPEKLRNGKLS